MANKNYSVVMILNGKRDAVLGGLLPVGYKNSYLGSQWLRTRATWMSRE